MKLSIKWLIAQKKFYTLLKNIEKIGISENVKAETTHCDPINTFFKILYLWLTIKLTKCTNWNLVNARKNI